MFSLVAFEVGFPVRAKVVGYSLKNLYHSFDITCEAVDLLEINSCPSEVRHCLNTYTILGRAVKEQIDIYRFTHSWPYPKRKLANVAATETSSEIVSKDGHVDKAFHRCWEWDANGRFLGLVTWQFDFVERVTHRHFFP